MNLCQKARRSDISVQLPATGRALTDTVSERILRSVRIDREAAAGLLTPPRPSESRPRSRRSPSPATSLRSAFAFFAIGLPASGWYGRRDTLPVSSQADNRQAEAAQGTRREDRCHWLAVRVCCQASQGRLMPAGMPRTECPRCGRVYHSEDWSSGRATCPLCGYVQIRESSVSEGLIGVIIGLAILIFIVIITYLWQAN